MIQIDLTSQTVLSFVISWVGTHSLSSLSTYFVLYLVVNVSRSLVVLPKTTVVLHDSLRFIDTRVLLRVS